MPNPPAVHDSTAPATQLRLAATQDVPTPVCFRLNSYRLPHWDSALELQLSSKHADAAAQLLPVLLCGEESAALVFDALQEQSAQPQVQATLQGIACDEYRHELLLRQLRDGLPAHEVGPPLRRALQRFFLSMADRDLRKHLARIVALDSAVCALLGALRARGKPLGCDRTVASLIGLIHRDEARHVRIARELVGQLSACSRTSDVAIEAREGLIEILKFRAAALDSLQVDPDKIFARLHCLSRGLFA